MNTLYQILAVMIGGLAVGFVALFGLHKMGLVSLDPVQITANIVYEIRN